MVVGCLPIALQDKGTAPIDCCQLFPGFISNPMKVREISRVTTWRRRFEYTALTASVSIFVGVGLPSESSPQVSCAVQITHLCCNGVRLSL